MPAALKATVAGVMLESSFARFKVWMAASNKTTPWQPLDRWDSASMVDTRGSCERTVRREGHEDDSYIKG